MGKTKHAKDELMSDATSREHTDGMNQLEVANEEDPFRRLPNEIMVNIISRQADLKSLCRYSLVSKYFAESISGVRTVSVNLSGCVTYGQKSPEFTTFLRSSVPTWRQMRGVLKRSDVSGELKSIRNINLPSFLRKLTELEYVKLEYNYPQSDDGYPFPMRKMNFVGGNSLQIEGFVALVPAGPDSIRTNSCDRKFLYGDDDKFQKESAKQMDSFWFQYYMAAIVNGYALQSS